MFLLTGKENNRVDLGQYKSPNYAKLRLRAILKLS